MLGAMLIVAALGVDPLAAALERCEAMESYRVTMRATTGKGDAQVIRYHWRRPGFVRMDFERPHRGALLVYSPISGKVTLRPFGAGVFPRLDLDPGNPLVRGPGGHTVDRSDIGVLLRNAHRLRQNGAIEIVGTERVGKRRALHVTVTGTGRKVVDGVHRYDLWLDMRTRFPLRAESRNLRGEPVEAITMDDPEIDVDFPAQFFDG